MANENFSSYKEKYEYLVKALRKNDVDGMTRTIVDTVEEFGVASKQPVPPVPASPRNTMTKAEIMKLKDPRMRQKLIKENANLFVKGEN